MIYCYGKGVQKSVLYWEVVLFSGGPLSRVVKGQVEHYLHSHRVSISSSSRRRETISLALRVSGLKSPPEMTIF